MEIKELIKLCKSVKAVANIGTDALFGISHDILIIPTKNLSKFLIKAQIYGSVSISYNEAYVYIENLKLSADDKKQLKEALTTE